MKTITFPVLILFLFHSAAFPQKGMIVPEIEKSADIPYELVEIYCDSTNHMDINSILSEGMVDEFEAVTEYKEELSNTCTYWLRFSISEFNIFENNIGLYIALENHIVEVHTIAGSSVKIQKTGFFVASRYNNEIIPLSNIIRIKGNGDLTFYVKIRNINDELPRFQLKLVNIESAILKNKRKITIDAVVQGMIWLMLLYGIFLFIIHRDKLYLFYSVYSLCLSLWLMGTWGFYYQFISDLPRELYAYQSIPGFIGIIFYIQFIRSFIRTPEIFPGWDKVLKLLQGITALEVIRIILFVPITNLLMANYYIQASVSMIIELVVLAFIIMVMLTKVQFKNIIVVGSAILIISNVAGAMLWVILNDNSWFIIQKTGAVAELAIFSFGLSYRYWIIEKKEHRLKEKLIIQLRKNEELKDKVNRELEQKVMERTTELKEKNKILEKQKNEIEYHNNNLTISINYAERIQSAVFPSNSILSENFPENFILFKPLDIVSGDFYWFKQSRNSIFVAAADCTGHGVPGAFMSILGITFMNEIVSRDIPVSPGELLNQLRNHIIKTLHQSQNDRGTRSGIDMALCIFDPDRDILHFSGAFRPLYLIRDNHLHEIIGDNMTVGIYDDVENTFTSKEIKLMQGDAVYLFTDGYVDQIGGTDRKTFKTGKFKDLLLKISAMPMNEQRKLLETNLEDWRGDVGQVDDILVIGIRYGKI